LKSYVCTEEGCEKVFKIPGALQDHVNGHTGIAAHECDHCDKNFTTRVYYARDLSKGSLRDDAVLRELPWDGILKLFTLLGGNDEFDRSMHFLTVCTAIAGANTILPLIR
ncbi:hypothetical protein PMAYCL1PPCAC_06129, partial [Pristionchus mayeri]